jgi:hypothetical protein
LRECHAENGSHRQNRESDPHEPSRPRYCITQPAYAQTTTTACQRVSDSFAAPPPPSLPPQPANPATDGCTWPRALARTAGAPAAAAEGRGKLSSAAAPRRRPRSRPGPPPPPTAAPRHPPTSPATARQARGSGTAHDVSASATPAIRHERFTSTRTARMGRR